MKALDAQPEHRIQIPVFMGGAHGKDGAVAAGVVGEERQVIRARRGPEFVELRAMALPVKVEQAEQ